MPVLITEDLVEGMTVEKHPTYWTATRCFLATDLRGVRQHLPRKGDEMLDAPLLKVSRRRIDRKRSRRGRYVFRVEYASVPT